MAEGKKLPVFMVLSYDERGVCKIEDVYFTRPAARARAIRLETNSPGRLDADHSTYHIVKKTVRGVKHIYTFAEDKKEIYAGYLN